RLGREDAVGRVRRQGDRRDARAPAGAAGQLDGREVVRTGEREDDVGDALEAVAGIEDVVPGDVCDGPAGRPFEGGVRVVAARDVEVAEAGQLQDVVVVGR